MKSKISLEKKIVLPEMASSVSYYINVDYKTKSYSINLDDWGAEEEQEQNYQVYKLKYYQKEIEIINVNLDKNLLRFVEHLLYDLIRLFKLGEINIESFIEQTNKVCLDYYTIEFTSKKQENDDRLYLNSEDLLRFYKLNGRYDCVLSIIQTGRVLYSFAEIHSLELAIKQRVITPSILFANLKLTSSLNNTVVKKTSEFFLFLEAKLDELYNGHFSYYQVFFNETKTVSQINKQFPKKFDNNNVSAAVTKEKRRVECFQYIKNHKNNEEIKKYDDALNLISNKESTKYIKTLWNKGELWLRYDETPFTSYDRDCYFVHFMENVIRKIFVSIILGSQSDFRESISLPRIGEGWVSETNLFNTINEFFHSEKVVHHASPKWLGKQHLDIYLPMQNIGVEYQGKQHSEPVEIFGGKEGFEKTVERDKRKKKLCKENRCLLLYVFPETDTDDFLLKLEKEIKKRKK